MKKLLHERLRECKSNEDVFHTMGLNLYAGLTTITDLMADEIERYYIPLPCDQEGKPWKIGDPVRPLNATSESHVTGYIYDGEEWYLKYRWAGIDGKNNELAKNCKRPQPKVYDADGVEIKVGDTVYTLNGAWCGTPLKVIEIVDSNYVRLSITEDNEYTGYPVGYVTHKEPVFDADGVRIKVGDKVWLIGGSDKPAIVEEIKDGCVKYRGGAFPHPEYLTHKEPDSLEKLRDDMARYIFNATFLKKEDEEDMNECLDRLTAIMERDA